jgi:hypothetical protein
MHGWNSAPSSRHETLGAVPASSRGTQITAGSSNAKGTPVSLGTSAFAYNSVVVSIVNSSAAADHLVDILVDNGAGARWVLADSLRIPSLKAAGLAGQAYHLPLHVPAGALLYARNGASTNSATCQVTLTGSAGGRARGLARCVPLFTAGSSRGFAWDPGNVANTDTGFQQISAGYAGLIRGLSVCLGLNGDIARSGFSYRVTIGVGAAAGTSRNVASSLGLTTSVALDQPNANLWGCFPCEVPASTPWWVRGVCDGTTNGDRTLDVCLYGMVA